MFRDARVASTYREASRFDQVMKRYAASSETWFDGSVDSVDHRLGHIRNLIHQAEQGVANTPFGDNVRYIKAHRRLKADQDVVSSLRDDLLTGGENRQEGIDRMAYAVTAADHHGHSHLSSADRRWLELESARFIADNQDCIHHFPELTARARIHARTVTSTRTASASDTLTGLFVARVQQGWRKKPRPRRTAAVKADFDDTLMYLG